MTVVGENQVVGIYTTVILPGRITVVYIWTKFFKISNLYYLAREVFPGRGFSWGAINAEKRGLEIFWGKCLKRNLDD